jgi:hypothetical protein
MNDPVPSAGTDSLRELVRDQQRKSRRTRLVLFVILPVVLLVGGVAFWLISKQTAEREIREAWSNTSACLVGAPLADKERASLRFRAVQLAAAQTERDKGDAWPGRCADVVAALFEKLRQHGRETEGGDEGLGKRAEQLALELRKSEAMPDLSATIDGLYEAAKDLPTEAVTSTAPAPDVAPNLDTMPESSRISPLQYTLDRLTGTPMVDTEVHVLLHDTRIDKAAILCTFTAEGKDRCKKLGGELQGKSGLRLSGTTDPGASPLVFAGRNGEDGIYRSDTGQKVTAMRAHSGFVAKNGYVALVGMANDDEGGFELVQQRAPGAPLEKRTIEPNAFTPKASAIHRREILWDRLIIQTVDEAVDDEAPHLHELGLPATEDQKPVSIAPLNWVNASIYGCRTSDTLIARVGDERGFLTFRKDDKWSTPVPVDYFLRAMTCDRGELVFTGFGGEQMRCTAAGCQEARGAGPTFAPFKTREGTIADLNGKVLVVMQTEKGGVRFRWDAPKVLDRAGQDRLLFDDLVKDNAVQKDSTVLGMMLLGRGRFAVALMTTPKGVYALRFGADGKPTPATIEMK